MSPEWKEKKNKKQRHMKMCTYRAEDENEKRISPHAPKVYKFDI